MSATNHDPDRLVKKIYAARAEQQGIDQSWPDLPDHARAYWRDLVDVMRPVIEEEMGAALQRAATRISE